MTRWKQELSCKQLRWYSPETSSPPQGWGGQLGKWTAQPSNFKMPLKVCQKLQLKKNSLRHAIIPFHGEATILAEGLVLVSCSLTDNNRNNFATWGHHGCVWGWEHRKKCQTILKGPKTFFVDGFWTQASCKAKVSCKLKEWADSIKNWLFHLDKVISIRRILKLHPAPPTLILVPSQYKWSWKPLWPVS